MVNSISRFEYFSTFESFDDRLPPQHIEVEEVILGGLMLDPTAIYRIWDKLKPEHFYLEAHKDIYQACLRLAKKQQPTDLLSVINWLSNHDLLARIGGRNKLAGLIDVTVSAVNIDAYADLLIEKSVRRDIIKLGDKCRRLGFSTEFELAEILTELREKATSVTETLTAKTEDDLEAWHYNRICKILQGNMEMVGLLKT